MPQQLLLPKLVRFRRMCLGHVIRGGNEVIAFTDANQPFGQHITLWLNGYLPK